MKKFLVVLVALVATAAMVTPVFAEDRLSLGGEMRVRAWYLDGGFDDTQSWADQRLRIGGKISVADGVSVTFRTDITEKNWGDGGSEYGSGRMPQDGMQWDRAHLDLTSGNFHLRAGQQYVAFGDGTVDSQEAGLSADLKVGAGKITVFSLLDEDNGKTSSDSFLSGIKFAMKNFSIFVANQNSALTAKENAYVIGATVNLDLGGVALNAEIDQFTGDYDDNTEVNGTQMMVGANFKASDAVSVGGQIFYAASEPDNANPADGEYTYTMLGNGFGGWDPIMDVGTSLSNEQISLGRPYDLFGLDAGSMALRAHTSIKAGDAMKLGASLTYAMPADEDETTVDSALVLAAGLVYNVMDNTSLQFQVEYYDEDDELVDTDAIVAAGTGLFVKF